MERENEDRPRYAWFRTFAPMLIGAIAFVVLHRAGKDLAAVLVIAAALAIALMLRRR